MTTSKVKFEIKNRWTGNILFEGEYTSLKKCVENANLDGANLCGADLYGANLAGANLYGANLAGADLCGANLAGADLARADLARANLYGANLAGADLCGANLAGADLARADLARANLARADLCGADLAGADLYGANLRNAELEGAKLEFFRTDLIAEILKLPDELENLRDTLKAGRIDGSTYSGECSCLAGTIAKHRGIEGYEGLEIKENGMTFIGDPSSPREQFFMAIRKGDTPENNSAAKIALDWVEEAIVMRDHIRKTVTA